MQRTITFIVVAIVAIAFLMAFMKGSDNGARDIDLYYYKSALDADASGNVRCSSDAVVPIHRTLPPTDMPIEDTMHLLIRGELTPTERESGISTEFPLQGFALKTALLEDGVLTLTFDDPGGVTGGGSCRVTILRAQIEKTALQFEGVETVRILPEELFQP